MKRYVYLELKILNGEYEYSSKTVHELEIGKRIDSFCQNYAKTFYGGKPYKDNGYYFFNGGEVAVKVRKYQFISEVEYNTLLKIIQ